MPTYEGGSSAIIAAPAAEIFDLMLDYEGLPSWLRAVRSATVLSRDEHGRAREVAYEIDVRLGVVRYTLRQHYEVPTLIASAYVEGDFRDCQGEWTFRDRGDGTTEATFSLRIDPGRIIPKPVARMLNRRVMRGSVEDLRRYYDNSSGG